MAMSSEKTEIPRQRRTRQPAISKSAFPHFDMAASDLAVPVDVAGQALPKFAEEIRRSIRSNLDNPKLSADSVAKLHGIDRRTLCRRLGAEGTSFSELHSGLRYESACLLLRDSTAPLSAITAALGYSEQSAFNRAFQTWSGTSPKRFRSMAAA